jgi:molybdate/tungstate transport system substrate-binding protein
MRKLLAVLAALTTSSLLLAGCGGSQSTSASNGSGSAQQGKAQVLYAGSLVDLMEHSVGPAFTKATGTQFQGFPAGSLELVNEIKGKVRPADVFISASTSANNKLLGSANGGWESWYAVFASAPLVIGYNPHSKFAHDLQTKPWQQVIAEPGFRLGSTDPKLDPKGQLAAEALRRAGVNSPNSEVFPEEQLEGRLQSGQLDAGFFYSNEATQLRIPTVSLANLRLAATYTVSALNKAPDQAAATKFVQFLLSDTGKNLLRADGLQLEPIKVTGDPSSVPAPLHSSLGLK